MGAGLFPSHDQGISWKTDRATPAQPRGRTKGTVVFAVLTDQPISGLQARLGHISGIRLECQTEKQSSPQELIKFSLSHAPTLECGVTIDDLVMIGTLTWEGQTVMCSDT